MVMMACQIRPSVERVAWRIFPETPFDLDSDDLSENEPTSLFDLADLPPVLPDSG